ncbi:recombinase family protein [Clostridium aestuarii]|uniref:Recombinase family protein n=1 Tax=Clostridium aestuarii TaxID=338193 RepID=A0ABT4CV16_9CLOT|nr:recombinase family protein [Clostridium aestuarii]MCY6482814.1 recombinase family protein [Clostridium aestuarii]
MSHTPNTPHKSNTKAAAYLRVSDRRQNLETQEAKAFKYAAENNLLLNKDMVFCEKKPASNTNNSPIVSDLTVVFKSRPELLKILTMASHGDGDFSHLIVYSSDRLARDVFQNALIKQHLEKNHVQIHFTKEGENFKNDPLSQKLQNILACFAEFEASTISSRVSDSLAQVFKRGDWTCGKPPLGFILTNSPTGKTLSIDNTKLDIVKTAFELYSSGYGYRKIADILSQKYFPYSFKKSTVEYMLSNEAYFGILSWEKQVEEEKTM